MKRLSFILLAMVLAFCLAPGSTFAQWSPYQNIQPVGVNILKGLRIPVTTSRISPWADRDSIAQVIFNSSTLKFEGRFTTSSFKPFATEDSVQLRWDSTKIKNYVTSRAPTLDTVLRNGGSSSRDITLGEIAGGAQYKMVGFSDYGAMRFTSTGDIDQSSNLVFTVGDNSDAAEGFIWRKDTANNGGTSPLYDTLATMRSNAFRVYKPISAMNTYVQASNGTINSILFYNGTTSGTVGTFTNHPFDIYSAGNARIRILTDGKVGIGTLAPAEQLSVSGNIIA